MNNKYLNSKNNNRIHPNGKQDIKKRESSDKIPVLFICQSIFRIAGLGSHNFKVNLAIPRINCVNWLHD